MSEAYVVGYVRTPIGRFGGALASVRPDDLAATAIEALMSRVPGVDPAMVDEVILGCANQAGEDNRNVARMSALLAGLPPKVPGTTVNRLCGSGMDAVATAARQIRCGEADLVVAGSAALELSLTGKRRALATMCIGVGQGIAIALEAV